MSKKIAIVGGGVSGIFAAILLARKGHFVSVYERNDRILKKLLLTGNGRCNFTNSDLSAGHFHGDQDFLREAYGEKDARTAVGLLMEMGCFPYCDERGRVYPMSLQASSVVDVLRFEVDALGIQVVPGTFVRSCQRRGGKFAVEGDFFDILILATGGMSYPSTGSDGNGYRLAQHFGHVKIEPLPSIAPLPVLGGHLRSRRGVKVDACVFVPGLEAVQARGDILFTEEGISGSAVFMISGEIYRRGIKEVCLDFFPDVDHTILLEELRRRKFRCPEREAGGLLLGLLHKKLISGFFQDLDIAHSASCQTLQDDQLLHLANALKSYPLKIHGRASWGQAQTTIGGICCAELTRYCASTREPGLYMIGEMLDVDGDCGGYNLTWALLSAMRAAEDIS